MSIDRIALVVRRTRCEPRRMPDHLLLDVFTDRPFTGNPLAVFVEPGDLDTLDMQRIANELNLAESVFTWEPPTEGGAWRTRIFTPQTELPFAGHPTIGAAWALVVSGRVAVSGDQVTVDLAEKVGDVPVRLECEEGRPVQARFTCPQLPESDPGPAPADAAAAIGLTSDRLDPGLAPTVWSAGVPFVVVAARDVEAVSAARPVSGGASSGTEAAPSYVLAPVDGPPAEATEWRARMFAPGFGIAEDPATGSAAAAAAGLLVEVDRSGAPERTWTIHQGVEMGRPSRIEVTIHREAGALARVEVGGSCVVVGSGRIDPSTLGPPPG